MFSGSWLNGDPRLTGRRQTGTIRRRIVRYSEALKQKTKALDDECYDAGGISSRYEALKRPFGGLSTGRCPAVTHRLKPSGYSQGCARGRMLDGGKQNFLFAEGGSAEPAFRGYILATTRRLLMLSL